MQLELDGKVVLVTGSTKGIGLAIAHALYAEGCNVVLNGRNATDLQNATAQLPGSIGVVGDVTQLKEAKQIIATVLDAYSRIDILVCNVGSGRSVPPGEESDIEWQRVFALNLWSATNMVAAARLSLEASEGVIVCISSICGLEVIPGAPITYSVAKAALNAYVRGIARPLGKKGVRINAVAAGNILFSGSVWSRKIEEDKKAVNDMLEKDVALSKLGSTADVTSLVTYLASPRSGFASGSVWTLDGGQVRS
jgi:3-oxoacyl-[acyl-carrier protein] reductase